MNGKKIDIPGVVLYPLGAAYSAYIATYAKNMLLKKERVSSRLLSPCNYAASTIALLALIVLTRKKKKSLEVAFASAAAANMALLLGSRCFTHLAFGRASLFLQHCTLGYFVCGSIFATRFLPVISRVAAEMEVGSHLDLKLAYLMLNISIYATHSFSMHFFNRQLQLPVAKYGWVSCMCVFYVTNMFLGPVADKYGITKRLAIGLSFVSTVIYTSFLLVKSYFEVDIFVICGIFSLYTMALSPIFSFYDVLVLGYLKEKHSECTKEERKEIFSRIRMWASVGHAIAGLVISYIYELVGTENKLSVKDSSSTQFNVLVGVVWIGSVFFMVTAYFSLNEVKRASIGENPALNGAEKENKHTNGKIEQIDASKHGQTGNSSWSTSDEKPASLFRDPDFLFLLFSITSIGVTRGISSFFLVSYMSLYFKLEFAKISSIMCLRTISELMVLYFIKPLMQCFGYYWLLVFSLFAVSLREFNYAHMPKSPYVLYYAVANEMLKGISSASLTFSAVNIADSLAGSRNKAQAQTCYSGCYNGLSILISSLLSVAAVNAFEDFRALFLSSSSIGFLCTSILVVKYGFIDGKLKLRRKRRV